jgi:hypothetical protein
MILQDFYVTDALRHVSRNGDDTFVFFFFFPPIISVGFYHYHYRRHVKKNTCLKNAFLVEFRNGSTSRLKRVRCLHDVYLFSSR